MDIDELAARLAAEIGDDPIYGDGATATIDDTHKVKVEVVLDDIPASRHINDCDAWGKVSEYCYRYTDGEGQTPRPEGFNGAARKIQVDRGYWMWWQPWDGFLKLSPEKQREEEEEVRWLLERGFLGIVVKLYEKLTDSRGGEHWVKVNDDALWGIDSLKGGYAKDVIHDLLVEVLHEKMEHA